MYILLQRTATANNTGAGAAFVETSTYWDTVARTYYQTQQDAATDTGFELSLGAEVDRWGLRSGQTRLVLYAGGGRVRTENAAGGGPGGGQNCTLVPPALGQPARVTVDMNGNRVGAPDGYTKLFGRSGKPPYQLAVTTLAGAVLASATRTSPRYPLEVFGLDVGFYWAAASDADGCEARQQFEVLLGAPDGLAFGPLLYEHHVGNGSDAGRGDRAQWNPAAKRVDYGGYYDADPGDSYFDMEPGFVDAYLLDDEVTFRTVRTHGGDDIYFEDEQVGAGPPGLLSLDNLILFNPDSDTRPGGVVVEVNASAPPLRYELLGTGQSNGTGYFDGLGPGPGMVRVRDSSGTQLDVPFTLRQDYGLRWTLDFGGVYGGAGRLELWVRGYQGVATPVCGAGESPVVLASDGLSGQLGGYGDIPAVVGTEARLSLLLARGVLEPILLADDRTCRCDIYAEGQLQFRGYVQPDIYDEALLGGLQAISITATDGLAALKDTYFAGHIGQRLLSRRPLLNTLLHCLSRCGVALPLLLATNRRSTEMSDADAPELAVTTARAGYWNKEDPLDCRAVVDALCQALGGTLCQREGQWQLRSSLEAAGQVEARPYQPAGTPLPVTALALPAGTVVPFSQARAPGSAGWGWLKATQRQQLRPGWKSLVGTTDAGWLENTFLEGDVFADPYAWLADGSKLRTISGWRPAPEQSFPLVLTRLGGEAADYGTEWPRGGAQDARYLESPLLPLEPEPEACPAYLRVEGRLLARQTLDDGKTVVADTAKYATLAVDLVLNGQPPVEPLLVVIALSTGKDNSTVFVPLPPLPAGTTSAVLRVYPWQTAGISLLTGELPLPYGEKYDFTKPLPVPLPYDPRTTLEAGSIAAYTRPGETSARPYQARKKLQVYIVEPGGVPVEARPYDPQVAVQDGALIVYQPPGPALPAYFYVARDLYPPVPAPPANGSDANWRRVNKADIADTNWLPLNNTVAQGRLLIASIGVQLRPREATWKATDNFRVDGPGGTVRPTEPLKVFHGDVPIKAGLFAGNRYAFSRAVALVDGSLSTAWARPGDRQSAPLFEANIYDALALRAGPSRLLTGVLAHYQVPPPRLLDTVDAAYDVSGRRFVVGASSWDLAAGQVEVSLLEAGAGNDAPDPTANLPDGVRITESVYEYAPGKYAPFVRATEDGALRVLA